MSAMSVTIYTKIKEILTQYAKLVLFFIPVIAYWYMQDIPVYINGKTMGTTYSIKAYMPRYKSKDDISLKIEARLKALNNSMSTYIKTSEISLFNALNSTKEFKISNDFFKVLKEGANIHKITNGFWDGSIYPLILLWGFNKDKNIKKEPSHEEINQALKLVDFSKIKLGNNTVSKSNPKMKIDLSSIAKGYGVDELAKILNKENISSYFVEIGGEVYVKGVKQNKELWKVGIHSPNIADIKNKIFSLVELKDKAIATSGNYRNYIKIKNKKYGHIFNPKSKTLNLEDKSKNIVSVSVIANNTMLADGLATAFMLMDINESLKIVHNLEDVEVYIIKRNNNSSFEAIKSENF